MNSWLKLGVGAMKVGGRFGDTLMVIDVEVVAPALCVAVNSMENVPVLAGPGVQLKVPCTRFTF